MFVLEFSPSRRAARLVVAWLRRVDPLDWSSLAAQLAPRSPCARRAYAARPRPPAARFPCCFCNARAAEGKVYAAQGCMLLGCCHFQQDTNEATTQLTTQNAPHPLSTMSSPQLGAAQAKDEPPPEFLCPITLDLMRDPVTAPTGITYDRGAITSWLLACGQRTCPMTHAELRADDLVPNHTLRRLIHGWCASATNRSSSGVVRVVPAATPEEAAVAEVDDATRAGDAERCAAAARWVRRLASLSERNRARLASAGAARTLATAFASFAEVVGTSDEVLDFVLAAMVPLMPMDEEAIVSIGSSSPSMARLVFFAAANGNNKQRRLQAVVVIRDIISLSFHRYAASAIIDLSENIDGIVQVLVKTIREAVCPQATRACLVAAYHLAYADKSFAASLAAAGLVPSLVELLVDADRSTAEKALAALDAALSCGEGRASARANALAVPVLVKKFFCVSDVATELVLSALLQICKRCPEDGDEVATATTRTARRLAIIEAMEVGALQKVILVLQAGYRQETKEKATELLRLMVRYQGRVECVDTMDLRGIKRGTTILTT
ncbi:hypothetical protein HU200_047971 [Digitaria exilis]|uniref:U-box domain-containing protein n=1 Tax=Digitaria exilis TaxID=1010633 RepID=A0A835B1L1_9POAL|nr:hypothetical protein HU200_047971 [Digitaria exilis]